MFESFKRLQLRRKGYSCGKKRRSHTEQGFMDRLSCSAAIKILLFTGFATGLGALILTAPPDTVPFADDPVKALLMAGVIFLAAFLQFAAHHPENYEDNFRVLLVFGIVILQLAALRGIQLLVAANGLPLSYEYLLYPYALAPITLSVLLGRSEGIFAAVFGSLWGCLLVRGPEDSGEPLVPLTLTFLIISLLCGFVGVYATSQVRKRKHLVRAGIVIGLTGTLLCLFFGQIEFTLAAPEWQQIGLQTLTALMAGIFTATLVGGILPMLESLFKITTDISWIELADLNHPLLKRLTIEAPGTYHHSLMVANLAQTAAELIGANALMCRVCSYFHDIGKLNKPEYYIENIGAEDNPHDDLTPTMSALVIIAHVKDGVDIAIKNKLNEEIVDIIQQHHGTSLVYYFYRRALDQADKIRHAVEDGKANEEDIPEVSKKGFRYPGPIPLSKESAIVSLADAVESASRALQKPSPTKIAQLVDEIIRLRIEEGQLDECDLTMGELTQIRNSFVSTLRSMLHRRIDYPDKEKKDKLKDKAKAKAKDDEKEEEESQAAPVIGTETGSKELAKDPESTPKVASEQRRKSEKSGKGSGSERGKPPAVGTAA